MDKFDIIVVGELNIDLILSDVASPPEIGKEILAGKMDLVLGSSSAILASNIASLGARTAFLGKLGKDDFGQFVIDCLNEKGINTDFIIRDDQVKTGASIILNYPEDRYIITHKGAMDELRLADIKLEYLKSAKHLHLSSYYLQDGIREDCPELFRRAKEEGLSTSFDTNWDPAEKWGAEIYDVLPHVDVFLPNQNEALYISREDGIEAALGKLAQYSKTVVIKLGKDGAMAGRNGRTLQVKGFQVASVDPVGAGDSFNAGFIFKYLKNPDLEQCMEFGNLCGALSVTEPGGTGAFSNREQIERDIERHFGYKIKL